MDLRKTTAYSEPGLVELLRNSAPYRTWAESSVVTLLGQAQKVEFASQSKVDVYSIGSSICLLEKGTLELVVTLANGRDHVLGYVNSGVLLGLPTALCASPTAEQHEYFSVTPGTLWRFPATTFVELAWQDRTVMASVLYSLSFALRTMADELANANQLSAQARVARCLLAPSNARESQGLLWHVQPPASGNMTQSELARVLGLSRQSVGTILRRFAHLGLTRLGRERVEILSRPGLTAIVQGTGQKNT